jgi:hypothetical protein
MGRDHRSPLHMGRKVTRGPMRSTYVFQDGTKAEPQDQMGSRGYNSYPYGWNLTYPNGRQAHTRQTLSELRAIHGKAKKV